MKVLVVDDSATVRQLMRIFLIQLPVEVLEASSGQAALEIAAKTKLDLIFTDYTMPPGIDGVELIKQLRGKLNVTAPIVLVTLEEENSVQEQAIAAGANSILRKPVKPEAVSGCATKLLKIAPKEKEKP